MKTSAHPHPIWQQRLQGAIAEVRGMAFAWALGKTGADPQHPTTKAALERALGLSKGILNGRPWSALVAAARRQRVLR